MSFCSTSLVSLSLGGCRAVTSLHLNCPYLEYVSLDGCDHLERARFSTVSDHLILLISSFLLRVAVSFLSVTAFGCFLRKI